jgi:hypothetical protein
MPYVRGSVVFVADSNSVLPGLISQSQDVLTRSGSMRMERDDGQEYLKRSKRFHCNGTEMLMWGRQRKVKCK